tara:strand:- start:5523 stop:6764 length:1242 start_codon:yes stop_codon:yes gene_type:complete
MTEAAFIAIHLSTGTISSQNKLHVNITPTFVGTEAIITSIIVGEEALNINGVTTNTNIENILEQVEGVKFTFNISPDPPLELDLEVINRAYYGAGQTSTPFFYFQVTPVTIPSSNIGALYIDQIQQITFTPYLLDIQFGFSEYNALISNASDNRLSDIRVESNRIEDAVLPTNWPAIISGSAFPAAVQDSLYSDTGWIRARYEGTNINSTGNAGISPAINGAPFTGEVFPSDADNSFICSSNREKQTIVEMLHTSDIPLPAFTTSSVSLLLIGIPALPTDPDYDKVYYYNPLTGSVDLGDILTLTYNNNSELSASFEMMRVLELNTTLPQPYFKVERGYADTVIEGHTVGDDREVGKVVRFDVFKFEDNQNNIRLLNDSKIYVIGNNTVIDTDDYGQLIRQYQCPYVEYIVTD